MSETMRDDGRGLWIPGPTWVRPEIMDAVALPMEGHRTASIEGAIDAIDAPLAVAFGAEAPSHEVGVHSCTASALMEMGLRAVGPRVLACVNGAFSARFAEIAEALGKHVTVVDAPLGAPADLAAAAERIAASPAPFDAVLVCTSETSTGAFTPAAAIGAALGDRRGAMLMVDAVTLLGAGPLDATANGLDFVLAGTQKALALPPGLGVYSVSAELLDLAARRASGSWFLDLARMHAAHKERKPPMTPTLSLLRALRMQLEAIESGTLEAELAGDADVRPAGSGLSGGSGGFARRFARHAEMARRTRVAIADAGVGPFGGDAAGVSPTITCVDLEGSGKTSSGVLADLAAARFTVAPGYGALKGRCIRIGHMGDHGLDELDRLLQTLQTSLA